MDIYTIPGLIATCFLIEQTGKLLLIDTGFLGFDRRILRKIRRIGRKPEDLTLVLVSHDHVDHFGGLERIHDESGAPVGSHKLDARGVAAGSKEVSPARTKGGRVLELLADLCLPFFKTRGVKPHVEFEDGDRLDEFGVAGEVVHTPGHTAGHISVLLDDGSAFAGDLVMGPTVVNSEPTYGSMALSPAAMRRSIVKLLARGAKRIYPAHGKPFPARELAELIDKHS